MSGSIRFDGDFGSPAFERRLNEALHHGQLPGVFGLVQDVVGHWAIPHDEQGYLRFAKALLDTLGSVLQFRESQREVVEGETTPTTRWLRKEGYTHEVGADSRGLRSFVRGALSGVAFRDRRVRAESGELARGILKEFELGGGRTAFLLDPWGGEPVTLRGSETQAWLGPYVRPEDLGQLESFVRETIWQERLGADTLLLDVGTPGADGDDEAVRVSAVSSEFDFASGSEAFNDVDALTRRCASFLLGGRSRRLLFHGPPGTGKSTLARAIARDLGLRAILLGHETTTRLADSAVVQILALLEPGVVVLNDVDRSGEHEAFALLHGLEALVERPTLAVLTANDIRRLDPAILRPGRVDEVREVPEPNRESRRVILEHYAQKLELVLPESLLEDFLERSEGFSPADLAELALTAQAVGCEAALEEVARIAAQRELYAGERCQEFNNHTNRNILLRRMRRRAM